MLSELIYKGLLHLERKKVLLLNTPNCPKCGKHDPVNQVQLVDFINVCPAKWKCRICKHKFEYEPYELEEQEDEKSKSDNIPKISR